MSITSEQAINTLIKSAGVDTNQISDGYHTFGELYNHRIEIFIALCRVLSTRENNAVWRSYQHSDGSVFDGWFIMGIGKNIGEQITYHLPMSRWVDCSFAKALELAPEWDGHTSADVLQRLKYCSV